MAPRPKTTRRTGVSARLREIDRILIACFLLGWVFAFAFIMGGGWSTPTLREMVGDKPEPPADPGLATASVVFMPPSGDTCRRTVIDNATWRVVSRAEVSCREVQPSAGAGAGPAARDTSRLDAIRDSFLKK